MAVLPLRVAVAKTVLPYANVTVPVGERLPDTVIVAVRMMGTPKTEGFGDAVNLTAESNLVTVWIKAGDVLWA